MALIAANYSIVFSKNSRRWYLCPGLFKSLFPRLYLLLGQGSPTSEDLRDSLPPAAAREEEEKLGITCPPGRVPQTPAEGTPSPLHSPFFLTR